jgi:hypothetical protein
LMVGPAPGKRRGDPMAVATACRATGRGPA